MLAQIQTYQILDLPNYTVYSTVGDLPEGTTKMDVIFMPAVAFLLYVVVL